MSNAHEQRDALPEQFAHIFAQLPPHDVEQFYKAYQLWTLQKRIQIQQLQIATLQQHIIENAEDMQRGTPSAIALATLAQLQSHGVDDIDLLDRMLDRGENWLDNTMQLLERCEELDMIQGDYSQWCEHALEGAYNWIASMPETAEDSTSTESSTEDEQSAQATADLLLQKLLTEDGVPPSPATSEAPATDLTSPEDPLAELSSEVSPSGQPEASSQASSNTHDDAPISTLPETDQAVTEITTFPPPETEETKEIEIPLEDDQADLADLPATASSPAIADDTIEAALPVVDQGPQADAGIDELSATVQTPDQTPVVSALPLPQHEEIPTSSAHSSINAEITTPHADESIPNIAQPAAPLTETSDNESHQQADNDTNIAQPEASLAETMLDAGSEIEASSSQQAGSSNLLKQDEETPSTSSTGSTSADIEQGKSDATASAHELLQADAISSPIPVEPELLEPELVEPEPTELSATIEPSAPIAQPEPTLIEPTEMEPIAAFPQQPIEADVEALSPASLSPDLENQLAESTLPASPTASQQNEHTPLPTGHVDKEDAPPITREPDPILPDGHEEQEDTTTLPVLKPAIINEDTVTIRAIRRLYTVPTQPDIPAVRPAPKDHATMSTGPLPTETISRTNDVTSTSDSWDDQALPPVDPQWSNVHALEKETTQPIMAPSFEKKGTMPEQSHLDELPTQPELPARHIPHSSIGLAAGSPPLMRPTASSAPHQAMPPASQIPVNTQSANPRQKSPQKKRGFLARLWIMFWEG